MSWSLNEIESLARKAARGSGLSWGLAEEAGKSVRWLVEFDLPGPGFLADLLTQNDKAPYDTLCPTDIENNWAASDGPLCPLITGALVCDCALRLIEGEEIRLGKTSYPTLLLPYVAAAAEMTDTLLEVVWDSTSVQLGPGAQFSLNDKTGLKMPLAHEVTIHLATSLTGEVFSPTNRGDIPDDVSKTLGSLAQRTYAPDTAKSRLSGAGAGLTDND